MPTNDAIDHVVRPHVAATEDVYLQDTGSRYETSYLPADMPPEVCTGAAGCSSPKGPVHAWDGMQPPALPHKQYLGQNWTGLGCVVGGSSGLLRLLLQTSIMLPLGMLVLSLMLMVVSDLPSC
jgi:hypothetical protein